MNNGIQSAINFFGSQTALAHALNVERMHINHWKKGKAQVPIKRCVQIEKLTGGVVTRKDLRPNDYHEIWTDIDDKETYDE